MSQWRYTDASQAVATRTLADGSSQSSAVLGGVVQMDGSTDIIAISLAELKAARKVAAEQQLGLKLVSGLNYPFSSGNTKNVQTDPESLADIAYKAISARIAQDAGSPVTWPAGFYWRVTDNTHEPLTAAQMESFAAAVDAWVTGLKFHLFSLKDQISTAADETALAAIDITSGWPVS